jgi:colanic acid/amylovoran biosynthesis glycosyltransferase
MTRKLAIFANDLGASFIDCHLRDILPGHTVAIGRYGSLPIASLWPVECPTFFLNEWEARLDVRLAIRLGISKKGLLNAALARFLKKHKVDVVLGEYLDEFLPFVGLIEQLGLPYVVQGHGIDVSSWLRLPGSADRLAAYNSARAVLTRSELHRQRLVEMGLPAARVHVNPGGVAVSDSPPIRSPESCNRFLAIGRMVPKKGPIYLLEAFRRAAAQNPLISLDYVGMGALAPAVAQMVSACGLSKRVRIYPMVTESEKAELLCNCGIFIQHSITDPDTGDEEGLPAAIQEAMAAGMAVVSTRHAGIPDAVEHGISGLLVGEGDVAGMAQAMLDAIPRAHSLGKAAHHRAQSEYTWSGERERLRKWLGLS